MWLEWPGESGKVTDGGRMMKGGLCVTRVASGRVYVCVCVLVGLVCGCMLCIYCKNVLACLLDVCHFQQVAVWMR